MVWEACDDLSLDQFVKALHDYHYTAVIQNADGGHFFGSGTVIEDFKQGCQW